MLYTLRNFNNSKKRISEKSKLIFNTIKQQLKKKYRQDALIHKGHFWDFEKHILDFLQVLLNLKFKAFH